MKVWVEIGPFLIRWEGGNMIVRLPDGKEEKMKAEDAVDLYKVLGEFIMQSLDAKECTFCEHELTDGLCSLPTESYKECIGGQKVHFKARVKI